MDLVTFLLDRFGEDEAEINQHPIDDGEPLDESSEPPGLRAEIGADWPYAKWLRIGKARALREVEVKRRIVGEHQPRLTGFVQALPGESVEDTQRRFGERTEQICPTCLSVRGRATAPCPTLRLLALPYDWHPDYDPEWKPQD